MHISIVYYFVKLIITIYCISYTQGYHMLKCCRTKSVFYTGSYTVSQKRQ